MNYIKALGVDQSLNATGIVFTKSGHIIEQKCMAFSDKDNKSTLQKTHETCVEIERFIDTHEPDYIQMEGLSYGSAGAVPFMLAGVAGAMQLCMYRKGYVLGTSDDFRSGKTKLITIISPSTMKKFNLGDGSLKKDTGYLLKVMQKVGLQFGNDNIADAFMHSSMVSIASQVLKGVVPMSNLPEWQQETLMQEGVKVTKGLSMAKALKLNDDEKFKLVRIY